jgi:non-specific protein-tyrosine kinase
MEFVNLDRQARTVMVTSAVQREGKSTTIANLAVALVQGGKRVALVDLDLRRPVLHRFFHIGPTPGATDVAVGKADLADALRPLPLGSRSPDSAPSRRNGAKAAANGHASVDGVLHVLPAGTLPPSPSDFIQDTRLLEILGRLADQFDVVLIDGPPLLAFGDGLSLSAHVDALFPVVRLNVVQRQALNELRRQIENCRAGILGFVLTGVKRGNVYRYGYEAYGYEKTSQPERVAERA